MFTCRVQSVNVDGKIDWLLGADTVSYLFDYAGHANRVNLPRLNNLEAAVSVVVVIAHSAQRRADPSVYVCVVRQQPFPVRVVEVRAVVDGCLGRRGSAEDFGPPGVEVGVEVDDADGAVGFVDGA